MQAVRLQLKKLKQHTAIHYLLKKIRRKKGRLQDQWMLQDHLHHLKD